MTVKLTRKEDTDVALLYTIGVPIAQIAREHGVHRSTIHRALARHGVETDRKKGHHGQDA